MTFAVVRPREIVQIYGSPQAAGFRRPMRRGNEAKGVHHHARDVVLPVHLAAVSEVVRVREQTARHLL
jgi:hypothetical protein